MSNLTQRVEVALAAASATLLSAHAHLSRAAAARLSSRLPAARTIVLYCRAHDLSPLDASWIRMQALARMGALYLTPVSTVPAGAGRIERIRCAIREWVRVQFAPRGDPTLQELLELEYASARAVILQLHVRNALRFASSVQPHLSGPAAVALYVDRMHVPGDVSGAVYAMAVARLAAVRFAAMLPPASDGARLPNSTSAVEQLAPLPGDRRVTARSSRATGKSASASLLDALNAASAGRRLRNR
jgi:hypothetical protein